MENLPPLPESRSTSPAFQELFPSLPESPVTRTQDNTGSHLVPDAEVETICEAMRPKRVMDSDSGSTLAQEREVLDVEDLPPLPDSRSTTPDLQESFLPLPESPEVTPQYESGSHLIPNAEIEAVSGTMAPKRAVDSDSYSTLAQEREVLDVENLPPLPESRTTTPDFQEFFPPLPESPVARPQDDPGPHLIPDADVQLDIEAVISKSVPDSDHDASGMQKQDALDLDLGNLPPLPVSRAPSPDIQKSLLPFTQMPAVGAQGVVESYLVPDITQDEELGLVDKSWAPRMVTDSDHAQHVQEQGTPNLVRDVEIGLVSDVVVAKAHTGSPRDSRRSEVESPPEPADLSPTEDDRPEDLVYEQTVPGSAVDSESITHTTAGRPVEFDKNVEAILYPAEEEKIDNQGVTGMYLFSFIHEYRECFGSTNFFTDIIPHRVCG
jgi:hypothetical protein